MKKIEIVSCQEIKQAVGLEVHQIKIINLYNELINYKNISNFLRTMSCNGYMVWTGEKDNKLIFRCDDEALKSYSFFGGDKVQNFIELSLVLFCKKMLTYWHENRILLNERTGVKSTLLLSRKQRGILTKILKINKRESRGC